MKGYLNECKDIIQEELKNNDTRETVSQAFGGFLTSGINSLSDVSKSTSTFGISIGLGLLGVGLAKKYRKSRAARAIAKIFGANVAELDKQFVLDKIKDNKDFVVELQKKITIALTAGTIDETRRILAKEFDLGLDEAMDVYLRIKDILLDGVIIGNIVNITDAVNRIEFHFGGQARDIENAINTELKTHSVMAEKQFEQAIEVMNKSFNDMLNRYQLLQSNLKLITPLTSFNDGSKNCWKRGYLFDEDIKNRYNARRPVTDALIESIENNNATILFGEGYHGKSVILKRVMFEEIEKGYAVVFEDGIEANTNLIVDLLNQISKDYSKLIFIADNIHRIGGEAIFGAFNRAKPGKIRFLFAARKSELDRDNPEVDRAFENIPSKSQYEVGFDLTAAHLFVEQAIKVTHEIVATKENNEFARDLYQYSKGDPFMFNLGLRYYLAEDKKTFEDFIALDLEKKFKQPRDKDKEYWKALLLSYILGISDVPISLQESGKLLACCGVMPYDLDSLVEQDFLLKYSQFKQEQYRVRHEKYALEFLVHLYHKKFGNNPDFFDRAHGIRNIIKCIWNNTGVTHIIDILRVCSYFYNKGEERYFPVSELIIGDCVVPYEQFKTPAHLSEHDKARLFCYGLGDFYLRREDYSYALDYYNQSTTIDNNFTAAWNRTGSALNKLGKYEDAIKCYEEAIRIEPDYGDAWYNKANALSKLGMFEDAIKFYEGAVSIKPYSVDAWFGKGTALGILGKYGDAIKCYDEVIKIKPDDAYTWYNKGAALAKLGKQEDADQCFAKAIELGFKV